MIAALDRGNIVYEREKAFRVVLGVTYRELYFYLALFGAFKLNILDCLAVLRLLIQRRAVAV